MGSIIPRNQDQQGVGHTYDLWKGFPRDEIFVFKDRNIGYGICDHFTSFKMIPTAQDQLTAQFGTNGTQCYVDGTTATIAMVTGLLGGGLRLFNSTDNEEVWMQYGGLTGAPFVISDTAAYMRELVFEVAFRISSTTTLDAGWFLGLASEGEAVADCIADGGTLAAAGSFLGLFHPEADTTSVDIVYQLGGQTMVTHADAWKTIAAATWYKFGLRYNANTGILMPWWGTGDGSTTKMEPDKDNKITAADIASATAYFPDGVEMSPLFGMKSGAAGGDVSLDLLFVECAQVV